MKTAALLHAEGGRASGDPHGTCFSWQALPWATIVAKGSS
jgi:hypothetical protein